VDLDALETEREKKIPDRIIPFFLVIAVCLAAGIALGSWTGGQTAASAEPKQAPLILAYLGYESFQPPARLQAIWILSLDGEGGAEFLGISPALAVTTTVGQAAVLRDFLSDPYGAPARIQQIPLIPQSATVVEIDRQGFSAIISRTGGIPIDGNYLGGQDVFLFLAESDPDPLAVLRRQLRLIQSMFASGPCPSESALMGLHPEHYLSSLTPGLLVSECRKRGPYLEGDVSFRIMDNVIPWQLPDGSIGLLPAE
jgi:hypothetical protein